MRLLQLQRNTAKFEKASKQTEQIFILGVAIGIIAIFVTGTISAISVTLPKSTMLPKDYQIGELETKY